MKAIVFSIMFAVVACGGSSSGSNNNPNGTPDAGTNNTPDAGTNNTPDAGTSATGCTVAVIGDADAGIQPLTMPCGLLTFTNTGRIVLKPAVEAQIASSFTGAIVRSEITISGTGGTNGIVKDVIFDVFQNGTSPLPTTITEQTPLVAGSTGYQEGPLLALPPSPRGWYAENALARSGTFPVGSFTIQLTSVTPTALTDCDFSSIGIVKCFRIHGTAHGNLVPDPTKPVKASGTVKLDFTF